jgi:hypothetical protein
MMLSVAQTTYYRCLQYVIVVLCLLLATCLCSYDASLFKETNNMYLVWMCDRYDTLHDSAFTF